MSPPNPMPTPLAGNPLALTDAERDARAGFDEDGNELPPADPAATPAVAAPAAPTPGAADVPPIVAPPADPAAAEPPAAAAEPVAAPPAPSPTPAAAALPDLRVEARDFKAELAALKKDLAEGAIDDEVYEERRDDIVAARAAAEVRETLSHDFAEHTWQQNVGTFLALPENAALLRSAEIQAVWQQTMQTAVNNAALQGKALTTDFEIMTAGRDLLFQQLGLSAPANPPPVAAPPPPKPVQAPPMNQLPPSLGGIPAAAPTGVRHTIESLSALDINEAERIMAGMSEAQQDELLRGTPGSFID